MAQFDSYLLLDRNLRIMVTQYTHLKGFVRCPFEWLLSSFRLFALGRWFEWIQILLITSDATQIHRIKWLPFERCAFRSLRSNWSEGSNGEDFDGRERPTRDRESPSAHLYTLSIRYRKTLLVILIDILSFALSPLLSLVNIYGYVAVAVGFLQSTNSTYLLVSATHTKQFWYEHEWVMLMCILFQFPFSRYFLRRLLRFHIRIDNIEIIDGATMNYRDWKRK